MNDDLDGVPVAMGPVPEGMARIECITDTKPNAQVLLPDGHLQTRPLHNGEAQLMAKHRPRQIVVHRS